MRITGNISAGTFAGFFSDEPCFGNNDPEDAMPSLGNRYYALPLAGMSFLPRWKKNSASRRFRLSPLCGLTWGRG